MSTNTLVRSFFNPVPFLKLLALVLGFLGWSASAQTPGSEWSRVVNRAASRVANKPWVQPSRGEYFTLDAGMFRTNYAKVRVGEPADSLSIGRVVSLPMPDGSLARFSIVEAPIMEPELAAKFPELKTYAGQGIDDPQATVRLDRTPEGFHAQILSPNGAVYVDPAYRDDATLHISYFKRDYVKSSEGWSCLVDTDTNLVKSPRAETTGTTANKIQSGATLRTYRLAVACTGEYAAFFGGTVSNAMSAIVTAVNRVDGVYETELAVRMVLIGNNNLLVFTNALTDPYTNNNGSLMLSQNQTTITSIIGSANYDIGHVFSTGGGGVAQLGCVCSSTRKAQGVTGSSSPTGDGFWIDYVAHEMGHQFGGPHTFNSTNGSCGGGNRNASTAYERGSGLSIMAYAGICPPDDLQPHSDPFFLGSSIDSIQTYISSGATCSVNTVTTNTPPTVNAGANYTIPAQTPFALTATASDPNGDTLTYAWEEMDLGAATALSVGDNGSSPLFRPFNPSNSPVRLFPRLSSILANTNWNQEVLPTTSRTMTFRVTVRDNRAGGGGVADGQMTVTTVASAGPFVITLPNTATNWSGSQTITWNVAGTTNAPISASGVNIYLSTNGGSQFQFLLLSNAPNIGVATVVFPNVFSSQARIKVQANNNIFFDINNANFSLVPGSATPLILSQGTTLAAESCSPTNGAIDPYETVSVNWTLGNFGNAAPSNLVATLLATNGIFYPGAPQSYGAIGAGSNVTRTFSFIPAGDCGSTVTAVLALADGTNDLGTVTSAFGLGLAQSITSTQVFNNASAIAINDNAVATPYPSTITVAGVSSNNTTVRVTLNGLSHTWIADVGALLVGPGGQTVKLFDGVGDGNSGTSLSGVALTFDDAATASLPASSFSSGTYLPTALAGLSMASPAPTATYGTTLSPLLAAPNGNWSLYVEDFFNVDSGQISGGWSLQFITTTAVTNCCTSFPAPTFTSTTYSNNLVSFSWSSLPGPHYQVQYTTNLLSGSWQNLGASILGTNILMSITDDITNSPMRFYRVQVGP